MSDRHDRVYVVCETNYIYHTERDCPKANDGHATPIQRDALGDHWRVCERCRYADVPALEDAPELRADGGVRPREGDGGPTLDPDDSHYHVVCRDCTYEGISTGEDCVRKGAEIHSAAFGHATEYRRID